MYYILKIDRVDVIIVACEMLTVWSYKFPILNAKFQTNQSNYFFCWQEKQQEINNNQPNYFWEIFKNWISTFRELCGEQLNVFAFATSETDLLCPFLSHYYNMVLIFETLLKIVNLNIFVSKRFRNIYTFFATLNCWVHGFFYFSVSNVNSWLHPQAMFCFLYSIEIPLGYFKNVYTFLNGSVRDAVLSKKMGGPVVIWRA